MKHLTLYDDEGDEIDFTPPTCFEVCEQCRGTGKSSAYLGAWTSSEWAQEDPDFKEDYMAGGYDRQCDRCGGKRVEEHVDWERFEREQPAMYQKYWEAAEEEAAYQAMCDAERRMGA